MRELVLTCAVAVLGAGCAQVVSHIDEYDAGPPPVSDAAGEAEASGGACASGMFWTGGNTVSALHHPGLSCIAGGCHSTTSKTPMTLGGTIYPMNGQHDVNECNGIAGSGVAVVPLDDQNMEFAGRIQVNSVGNFYTNKALPPSFRIKVIYMGNEAAMTAPLSDGNCNSCHTFENFMNAKGRIIPAP